MGRHDERASPRVVSDVVRSRPGPRILGRVPYPLETPRLRIEPLGPADTAGFVAYRRDPDVARFQSWEPTYSEEDAERLIEAQPEADLPAPGGWLQLAARSAGTGDLLGDVAVHTLEDQPDTYEIGVTLARSAQGSGIATEAVTRVIGHLFEEAGAYRVVAYCDSRNAPVARLLTRVGMRHESRCVEADYVKGEWTTLDGYAILAREFSPSPPFAAEPGRL
jgi:RimJ/RimL family protein N-acetyltransferase